MSENEVRDFTPIEAEFISINPELTQDLGLLARKVTFLEDSRDFLAVVEEAKETK